MVAIQGSALDIGPMQGEEAAATRALVGQALRMTDYIDHLMEQVGPANWRVARQGGRPVAGLGMIHGGQWFGGASVPSAQITGVGVAPEARGAGVSFALLRATLEELQGAGIPLSVLYPSTLPVYRKVGYERAGARITYELPVHAIDARVQDRSLAVVPLGVAPGGEEMVRRAYTIAARRASGNLDRAPFNWNRVFTPFKREPQMYLVTRGGEVEGYIALAPSERDGPLRILDVCALTGAAAARILALLADHRSIFEKFAWSGGPVDPFLFLLSGHEAKVLRSFDWVLRIVDVAGALRARDYPPGLEAELHLDVRDDLLPMNNGQFTLRVAGGRATVQRGGKRRLRLDVRDLAALYTGHLSPAELRLVGSLDGPEPDLATAGLVFAGPRPFMSDMF